MYAVDFASNGIRQYRKNLQVLEFASKTVINMLHAVIGGRRVYTYSL